MLISMKIEGIRQPVIAPIFLCLPERVKGTPSALLTFDFAPDIPVARFQEKPPLPTNAHLHLPVLAHLFPDQK